MDIALGLMRGTNGLAFEPFVDILRPNGIVLPLETAPARGTGWVPSLFFPNCWLRSETPFVLADECDEASAPGVNPSAETGDGDPEEGLTVDPEGSDPLPFVGGNGRESDVPPFVLYDDEGDLSVCLKSKRTGAEPPTFDFAPIVLVPFAVGPGTGAGTGVLATGRAEVVR